MVDWQTLGWVFLALLQFVIIVIDRVLYLRRSIFSKAVLQMVTLLFFFLLFFFDMVPRAVAPRYGRYSCVACVLEGLF